MSSGTNIERIEQNNSLLETNNTNLDNLKTIIESMPSPSSNEVKLFSTVEEMNSSTGNVEGDLAVVYREELKNMTAEVQTQIITFPETVVLPEAFDDSVYTMLRAVDDSSAYFDGQIELSQASFRFDGYSDSGSIRVTYTSTDGITYTRTTTDEIVDCGTLIACYYADEWDDAIGYFIKIGGKAFEGIYEYGDYVSDEYIYAVKHMSAHNNRETELELTANLNKIYELFNNNLPSDLQDRDINLIVHKQLCARKSENEYDVYSVAYKNSSGKIEFASPILFLDGGKYYLSLRPNTSSSVNNTVVDNIDESSYSEAKFKVYKYTINISTETVTYIDVPASTFSVRTVNANSKVLVGEEINFEYIMSFVYHSQNNNITYPFNYEYIDDVYLGSGAFGLDYAVFQKYLPAETQFNATSDDVYDKIFYGRNGVEEGSLQNITNIDKETFKAKLKIRNSLNNFSFTEGTSLSGCFSGYAEKYLPNMDTTNVTSLQSTFYNCANLVDVPLFNTLNLTSIYKAFENCPNLSDESLNNILAMCTNAIKITSNKTLQLVGLTEEQATRCTTLSNYEAFVAAGWTTGY